MHFIACLSGGRPGSSLTMLAGTAGAGRWRASEAERSAIELHLAVAADLISDLLPGCGDRIRTLLHLHLPGENLGEFVLGDAVILEDARDARLDRRVLVI